MLPSHDRHGFSGRAIHLTMHVLRGCLLMALFALGVMLLWNLVMPSTFHAPTLTYWKALGLILLSRLLFGWHMPSRRHVRFRGGPGGGPRCSCHGEERP